MVMASLFLYLTEVSLRGLFFELDGDGGTVQVAHLQNAVGTIRRKFDSQNVFKSLKNKEPLFNLDTIVTGPEGKGTVEFNDGSVLNLGPNTMVRLSSETELTLTGLSRARTVNVVSGTVTGARRSSSSGLVLRSANQVIPVVKDANKDLVVERKPSLPRLLETVQVQPPVTQALPQSDLKFPPPSPKPEPTLGPFVGPLAPLPETEIKPLPVPPVAVVKVKPAVTKIIVPQLGSILPVPPQSEKAEREVELKWSVTPPDREIQVVVQRQEKSGKLVTVSEQNVKARGSKGSLTTLIKTPGSYFWHLREVPNLGLRQPLRVLSRSRFIVPNEFEAIRILTPLVGGEESVSNVMKDHRLKEFDITLRWKPYADADNFSIRISKDIKSKQMLLDRKVNTPNYLFNKNKLNSGRIYYQVRTELDSGFVVRSPTKPFVFNFLPPILTSPDKSEHVSKRSLASSENALFFTWQKTNFTDNYEIEVSADPGFRKVITRQKESTNYFSMPNPPVGKVWWRVKSYAQDFASDFSAPQEVTVSP